MGNYTFLEASSPFYFSPYRHDKDIFKNPDDNNSTNIFSAYFLPDTVFGARDSAVHKNKSLPMCGLCSSEGSQATNT